MFLSFDTVHKCPQLFVNKSNRPLTRCISGCLYNHPWWIDLLLHQRSVPSRRRGPHAVVEPHWLRRYGRRKRLGTHRGINQWGHRHAAFDVRGGCMVWVLHKICWEACIRIDRIGWGLKVFMAGLLSMIEITWAQSKCKWFVHNSAGEQLTIVCEVLSQVEEGERHQDVEGPVDPGCAGVPRAPRPQRVDLWVDGPWHRAHP